MNVIDYLVGTPTGEPIFQRISRATGGLS